MKVEGEFSGDLGDLNEKQLDFLRNVFKEQDLEGCNVTVESGAGKGENYSSTVKSFKAEKDGKVFHAFAKVAPKIESLRTMTLIELGIHNEVVMYSKVLPRFVQLQKFVGTPQKDLFQHAEYYGSLVIAPNEIILLEDLREKDYLIRDRFEACGDKEVRCALKSIATFHALSFVLKEKNFEEFNKIKNSLLDLWGAYANNKVFNEGMPVMEEGFMKLLDKEEHKRRVKGFLPNFSTTLTQVTQKSNSKYECLVHGDCWSNNIMFKKNGKDLECILIDYQLSKIGSPVMDIMYFIFNCTEREDRKKYYNEWIDYYHKCFDNTLSDFNMKSSFVYPREKLDADFVLYGRLMFCIVAITTSVIMRSTADVFDMDEVSKHMANENKDKLMELYNTNNMQSDTVLRIKKRMCGMVECFIDLGYI